MKHLSTIISVCILSFSCYAQQIIFYGYTTELFAPVDSIKIGFHPEATMGIDEHLGETDISEVAINEHDIRVQQRSEDSYDCLVDEYGDTIIYQQSFDSKINLRPMTSEGKDRYFEISNLTKNFTGGYTIYLLDYTEEGKVNESYLGFYTNVGCMPQEQYYGDILENVSLDILYQIGVTPTDWQPDAEPFTKFYFLLEPNPAILSSLTSVADNTSDFDFYPNPANNFLRVEKRRNSPPIQLYNSLGLCLMDIDTESDKIVDISYLPCGMYYLSNSIVTKKIVIHR